MSCCHSLCSPSMKEKAALSLSTSTVCRKRCWEDLSLTKRPSDCLCGDSQVRSFRSGLFLSDCSTVGRNTELQDPACQEGRRVPRVTMTYCACRMGITPSPVPWTTVTRILLSCMVCRVSSSLSLTARKARKCCTLPKMPRVPCEEILLLKG